MNKPKMPLGEVCGYVYAGPSLRDEYLEVGEDEAASDIIRLENTTGTVARGSANRGGQSSAARGASGLDSNAVVRAWFIGCGVSANTMPKNRAGLLAWGREWPRRPQTKLCADCQESLCEDCWAAYDAGNLENNQPSTSGAGSSDAHGSANDDTASRFTATF